MTHTSENGSPATGSTGEPELPSMKTMFEMAGERFGVPTDVFANAVRRCTETSPYPLLAPAVNHRLKVYLDLKDWVALAKARLGRPEYPHDQVAYEMLRDTTLRGEVMVPLTFTTYLEVSRIASLRQRTDLTDVITEISGFVTIIGRSVFVEHQLHTALASRFGGSAPAPIPVFGLGVSFAAGELGHMSIEGRDGTAPDLPAISVFNLETVCRTLCEYMMLRGPDPSELEELRALGYRPEELEEIENQRVQRERDLAERLRNGDAHLAQLGDIVHARQMYWELDNALYAALAHYGVGVEDFFAHGKEWLTAFLDDVPSAAVAMTLGEKNFRMSDRAWTGNDIRDSDAMFAAVPYCDVVMTDKHVAAQLKRSPVVTRLGTHVLSRLRDLNDLLPGLIASRRGHAA
ncbi:hypothetical protein [Catenulispora rubra]|uniref:hypothetical protein n=1 Tax=Catenulispora rubra TaxID=280293 RepID=UPI0018927CA8|nr:hypothetical protein [Catenulispora rubra]